MRYDDKIECQICKKLYKVINWSHLYSRHNITYEEYKKKYQVEPTISPMSQKKYSEGHKRTWLIRPDLREERRKLMKKLHQERPDYKRKLLEANKKKWEDSKYKKKMLKILKKNRKIISERLKKEWQDPVKRVFLIKHNKEIAQNPKTKELNSKLAKIRWQNPEMREKMIENRWKGKKNRKELN